MMLSRSRAATLRRCADLLAKDWPGRLAGERVSRWLEAAAPCQLSSNVGSIPAGRHTFAASASSVPADQLPLPESSLLKDDLEDARRAEADDLPAEHEGLAAAAALPGQQFVQTDAVASLPMGQALRQQAAVQGRTWAFETGKLARLAAGSCLVRVADTSVLAAATCQPPPWSRRDAQQLQFEVEYREKLYAVGRIPSTYNKREGAAKEHEVLAGRRIDRALRPLFPKGFALDAAVFASVLSADGTADPDVLAICAASAALQCSPLPWAGPVGAARAALLPGGELVVSPSVAQQEAAALNVLVACTADRVTMLEAEGDQIPEADFLRALRAAVEAAQQLVEPQRQLAQQTGRQTQQAQLAGADSAAVSKVADLAAGPVEAILRNGSLTKSSRAQALQQAKEEVLEQLKASGAFRTEFARVPGSGCVSPADLEHAFSAVLAATLRRLALEEGWRCDGRGPIDLRPVHCEVDSVPVVHGSALFTRGETQSLCTVTVGRRGEQQRSESLLGGESSKRLFVNYSFPAFAVGDTSIGGLRREMGHSELAERALLPVLPDDAAFPFSLRLNADTLASSGSSSMAAVCGGSLALADAGVPLKALVAGVTVGLVTDSAWDGAARKLPPASAAAPAESAPVGRYELLTDQLGMEDQLGDMDLKVAGGRRGITACQLDVKLPGGVPLSILEEALAAAARARAKLLTVMEAALPKERAPSAPVFGSVRIPEGMIGRVIGKEGCELKALEQQFDARLEIGDSGLVSIFAPTLEDYKGARSRVLDLSGESVQEGQVYRGTVSRLLDFGAHVTLEPSGARAWLHISEVSPQRLRSIEDALREGQQVEVLCLGKDGRGQLRVSRKAVLAREAAQAGAKRSLARGGGVDADK
ncbi:hypothetical protein ABPG77_008644 [Micractinium sp. CCAP 211/92]